MKYRIGGALILAAALLCAAAGCGGTALKHTRHLVAETCTDQRPFLFEEDGRCGGGPSRGRGGRLRGGRAVSPAPSPGIPGASSPPRGRRAGIPAGAVRHPLSEKRGPGGAPRARPGTLRAHRGRHVRRALPEMVPRRTAAGAPGRSVRQMKYRVSF